MKEPPPPPAHPFSCTEQKKGQRTVPGVPLPTLLWAARPGACWREPQEPSIVSLSQTLIRTVSSQI